MRRIIVLLGLAALRLATAQQSSPRMLKANAPPVAKSIPAHLMYRQLLNWVVALDNEASASGSADPYAFAQPFADRIGLDHPHVDVIRNEAQALDKDLTAQDARASSIVAKFRAVGKDALNRGLPIPVAPGELRELQQERDTIIKSHVSILRAALGPQTAARLDAYLSGEFAPHISLKALAVPHTPAAPNTRQ
ncbi:MAG TPA: hypothetical protein VH302_15550 [Bryobacteraceae bacterium]|nr:hypothetical protein [Bryobacteraceae bacterium]